MTKFATNFKPDRFENRLKRKRGYILIVAAALILFSCKSTIPDGQLRSTISDRLFATAGMTFVTISVEKGVAKLTGTVSSEGDKALAESLAKIEGITSVDNRITVVSPTPEETISTIEDAPLSLEDRLNQEAQELAENYWKEKLTKCGDSLYWKRYYQESDQEYYQANGEPYIWVKGSYHPPRELSEAQRLNKVDPQPAEYDGTITLEFPVARLVKGVPCTLDVCSWKDNFKTTVAIRKAKGAWNIDSGTKQVRSIQCTDVILPEGGEAVTKTGSGQINFPATHEGWYSLGKGPFTIGIYGTVSTDAPNNMWTNPTGFKKVMGDDALAPGLALGALVAKRGKNGKPFAPITNDLEFDYDGTEELFIGINDSDYTDNKGYFRLCIFPFGKNTSGNCTS